jgi:hypothetical protein
MLVVEGLSYCDDEFWDAARCCLLMISLRGLHLVDAD